MSTVEQQVDATPKAVWDVLADGWLFAGWVVGTSRIRAVDDAWPAPDSCIYHSVGTWPAVLDDTTTVLESEPSRRLVLRARGWPLGEAHVDLRITAAVGGTMVTITEEPVAGPGLLAANPVADRLLDWRNRESLWRLARLAEGRAGAVRGSAARRSPRPAPR